MLESQMPHALILTPNPVFAYDLRHLRWPRTPTDLKRYSLTVLVAAALLLVGFWLLARVIYGSLGDQAVFLCYLAIICIDLLMMIAGDVFYMLMTVGSAIREIEGGQWDLLRVSLLQDETILYAKYAIAGIRAWRVMALEIAIRVAGLVVLVLLNGYALFMLTVTLPVSLYLFVVAVVYILEPLWRMRAAVALGMAVAIRIHSFSFASVASFALILVFQIVPLGILVALWAATIQSLTFRDNIFCLLPGACAITAYLAFTFYRVLRDRSLHYAVQFISHPD